MPASPVPVTTQNPWAAFTEKFDALNGDHEHIRHRYHQKSTQFSTLVPVLKDKYSYAADVIANWWKRIRSSGRFILTNLEGDHPNAFFTFVNAKKVSKILAHFQTLTLLNEITNNPWQSRRFRNEQTHRLVFNLFASGKISW